MHSAKNVCQKCHSNPSSGAAVIQGVYYASICSDCISGTVIVSSGDARWRRSVDAEDHEAEIQQPYMSDGSINTRFAKLYPKQAAALFTEKQIRDANR